ncbi:MAG: hypothetical protein IJJ33_15200 [Victivallales bacterium]|nr:hypothetical protein [Victivallales bacterium]
MKDSLGRLLESLRFKGGNLPFECPRLASLRQGIFVIRGLAAFGPAA